MKKIFVIITLIAINISFVGCSKDGKANQQSNQSRGIPVRSMWLQPRPFAEYLQITGTAEARNRVNIVAEEAGTLRRVIRDKGSIVRKTDTLAIIENKILEASFNEARAALNQAELDFSSKKVLFEKRAISENEYLASKYGLERAQAAFELNKARFSKLYLTAPLNGYVNERNYDIGSYTMPGSTVFDFIDNAYMKIIAGVAERFLNDIKIGTQAEITFDAFPNLILESEVSFINRSIDPLSRTFKIEIKIPNPERNLAPQMSANVKLLRRSYENQIVIPLDALIESEEGRYVFTISDEKLAKKTLISILAVYQDSVLVDGLKANQRLIVIGQQDVTDGDTLEVQEN
jgi:RND family efflux transporter MFP subunit